jgi:short subunit dehydrogenase-like uncharacterized protein
MFTSEWIVYGATGTTGELIARAAVARGHRPLLAGRREPAVRALAEELDLPWRVADVADTAAMAELAAGTALVLLAASPFQTTSPPVVDACLAAGAHYLDVANETPLFESVYARDDAARRAGVTLLPGVGFGVVATDTLARHVADRLPGADRLELTLLTHTAGTSPGARANTLRALAAGGLVRRAGRLTRVRLGADVRQISSPAGARTVMAVPTGDLAAAYRTTGIGNITARAPITLPAAVAPLILPAAGWLARSRFVQRRAAAGARRPVPETTGRSYVGATASRSDGRRVQAWLETGEGYAFAAHAAVRAVEAVLAAPVPGAHSPGALLGADFALDLPDTSRYDGPVA